MSRPRGVYETQQIVRCFRCRQRARRETDIELATDAQQQLNPRQAVQSKLAFERTVQCHLRVPSPSGFLRQAINQMKKLQRGGFGWGALRGLGFVHVHG